MQAPAMAETKEEVKVEELTEEEEKLKKQNELEDTTAAMINQLESIGEEKYRKSELLGFLKQLNKGALEIEGNELVENKEKQMQFQAQQAKEKEIEQKMMQKWSENKTWDPEEMSEDQRDSLMEEWNSIATAQSNVMDTAWEESKDTMLNEEEAKIAKTEDFKNVENIPVQEKLDFRVNPTAMFNPVNKFMGLDDPISAVPGLLEKVMVKDAMLALEAELQNNAENAEAWRQLGQLHIEMDQDDEAIGCLLKAYELDPFDLESLIYLGSSCSNIYSKLEGMQHLLNWVKYNPQYNEKVQIPEGLELEKDEYKMREQMANIFHQCIQMNPTDPDLLVCAGITAFQSRQFSTAAIYFKNAVIQRPKDHTLWNKYGAALTNNYQQDDAEDIFSVALLLRPNLVRTWTNLGFVAFNHNNHKGAVHNFLNAISLNPKAQHLWEHLDSSCRKWGRHDLLKDVRARNLDAFKEEFKFLDPENLHQPDMEALYSHPILQGDPSSTPNNNAELFSLIP